jgi:5-methylcytosine-specific restriction endonuclease McrA
MPRLVRYLYLDLGYSIANIADEWCVDVNVAEKAVYRYVDERRDSGSTGAKTERKGKVDVECEVCSEPLKKWPSRIAANDNHFCSFECRGEYDSEQMVGEKNPAWKGGYSDYYGDNWPEQRKRTLERDGYECRACGMPEEEHQEQYGQELEVHHVVPVREFNDPADANSLGNLVTSCVRCHRRYEGMPVFPK